MALLSRSCVCHGGRWVDVSNRQPFHFIPEVLLSCGIAVVANNGSVATLIDIPARRTEQAARFNELQAKVINEIDRAVSAYRVAQENLETLQSLAAAQKQQSEGVEEQEEAGASDKFEVLNSLVELAASELVQLDGRVQAQQAFAALEDAVQRPIDSVVMTLKQPDRSQQAMKENKQ